MRVFRFTFSNCDIHILDSAFNFGRLFCIFALCCFARFGAICTIEKKTFKNPGNPSRIDLILTNSPRSFQKSNVFETVLSNFYKLTTTVLRQYFPKLKPKVVHYRDYQKFRNDEFRAQLENEI